MKIRTVIKEFEAHIHPAQPGGRSHGKSEWKHYGDGTYRFKISIRNIPLPDGGKIEVVVDETRIAQLTVQNQKAKIDIESDIDINIPAIKAGQKLQVKTRDFVLAEGQYIDE